jgi:hypothetical protein
MVQEVGQVVRVVEVVDACEDRATVCFSTHSDLTSACVPALRDAAQRRFCTCDIRCRPASVLGPVDRPPWFGHRPFVSALRMHGLPSRVRAPHLRGCERPTLSSGTVLLAAGPPWLGFVRMTP